MDQLRMMWIGLCMLGCAAPPMERHAPPGTEDFKVIWERPALAEHGEVHGHRSELAIMRVGINARSLALDLELHAPEHNAVFEEKDLREPSETPTISILADGCPVEGPVVSGRIARSGASSRIMLPRGQLPTGDLEITVSALSHENTMLFSNDARGLRTIVESELKSYREIEGDPARGVLPSVEVVERQCPNVKEI